MLERTPKRFESGSGIGSNRVRALIGLQWNIAPTRNTNYYARFLHDFYCGFVAIGKLCANLEQLRQITDLAADPKCETGAPRSARSSLVLALNESTPSVRRRGGCVSARSRTRGRVDEARARATRSICPEFYIPDERAAGEISPFEEVEGVEGGHYLC